jgi:hypothetical protein
MQGLNLQQLIELLTITSNFQSKLIASGGTATFIPQTCNSNDDCEKNPQMPKEMNLTARTLELRTS